MRFVKQEMPWMLLETRTLVLPLARRRLCNPNLSTLHMPQPLRCLIFLLFLPMGRRLLCMFHPNFGPIKFHEAEEVVLIVEEEEDNSHNECELICAEESWHIMMKLIWGGAELAMPECVLRWMPQRC